MGSWNLVNPRAVLLKMSSADYTPFATGVDLAGLSIVPYDPNQNEAVIAFTVIDIVARVEQAASSGTTSIKIQRSTGSGVFSNVGYINTTSVDIAAGSYEPSARPASIANPNVNSGDKLMAEMVSIGSGISGFTLYVVLLEVG